MSEPSTRASYLKETLATLQKLDAAAVAEMKRRLPDVFGRIEAASNVEWLPLAFDGALMEALFDIAGVRGVRALGRVSFVDALGGPRYGPIFRSAIQLFGLAPPTFLKVAALGFKQTMRDAGALQSEVVSSSAALATWTDAPSCICSRAYAEAFCGTFEGMLEITKRSGSVEVVRHDGPIQIRGTWS